MEFLTGVDRCVELMQIFKQAANQLNDDLKPCGADMAGTALALTFFITHEKCVGYKMLTAFPVFLKYVKQVILTGLY